MPAFAPVTIAGLSKLSGVDVEVIRDYVAAGLVPPPRRRRGRSGDKAFHREHLDRLRFTTRGLALGFSLDAIRELLGVEGAYRNCGDVYRLAQRTLAEIRAMDAEPPSVLQDLAAACPQRGGHTECPILAQLRQPE
jgi:MerR family mercuric resistance operon transcriptional regulator